jgi:hypothetical protein
MKYWATTQGTPLGKVCTPLEYTFFTLVNVLGIFGIYRYICWLIWLVVCVTAFISGIVRDLEATHPNSGPRAT